MPGLNGAVVMTLLAGSAASQGDHFGPGNCVSVSKSTAGTCVFTTACEGKDTSNFEFAFDCRLPGAGATERHSFGLGGFDAQEEYDTEVQCDMCTMPGNMPKLPPPKVQAKQTAVVPMQHAAVPKPGVLTVPALGAAKQLQAPLKSATHFVVAHKAKTEAVAQTESAEAGDQSWATPPPKEDKGAEAQVKYGPKSCVSTWRSTAGHCIVQTDCEDAPIQDYEFGLVCVDNVGKPIRHLFGKGSFDPVETFDTLIKCKQCLGLTDVPDELMLNNEVLGLAEEVKELQGMMTGMTDGIKKLNQKVFAPAAAPAAAMPQSPAAAVVLKAEGTAHHHHHGKKSNTAHQKHHLRKQSYTKLAVQQQEEVQDAQETAEQSSAEEQAAGEQTADQQEGAEVQQAAAESTEQQADTEQEADQQQADEQQEDTQQEDEQVADEQQQEEQQTEPTAKEGQADGEDVDQAQTEQEDSETER